MLESNLVKIPYLFLSFLRTRPDQFVEILLSMGPGLCAIPRDYMLVHFVPVFAKHVKPFNKFQMLLVSPSAILFRI